MLWPDYPADIRQAAAAAGARCIPHPAAGIKKARKTTCFFRLHMNLTKRTGRVISQFGFQVPQLDTDSGDRIMIGHLRKQAGHDVNLFSQVTVVGLSRSRSHMYSPHFQRSGGRDAPLLAMYLCVLYESQLLS